MNSKIAVIGANSFSGQDFIDLLLSNPQYTEVIGISRSPERSPLFLSYKLNPHLQKYRYAQLDLNQNMPQIIALLDSIQPAYIVNFAAQSEVAPSWIHPEHWFQTNTVALAGLIKHLSRAPYLKRYLHISSPEVYGACTGNVAENHPVNPSTPYAASKASADLLLGVYRKQFDFPLVSVRATNVYGARQQLFKIIPRTAIYLRKGEKIQLHGGGQAVKSYIHIRDVSKGELAILEHGKEGELYHLSPDAGISVKEVVQTICDTVGKNFSECTETVEERPGQDAAYVIDSTKARKELGWAPEIGIKKGLEEVLAWVDEYWTEINNHSLSYDHKR